MRRFVLILLLATSARARVQAVHRVYSIDEDGMTGTREEWVTSDLKRRESVDHGYDQTLTVYDGTNGWRRDWNGFVEKLADAGDDRHEADFGFEMRVKR